MVVDLSKSIPTDAIQNMLVIKGIKPGDVCIMRVPKGTPPTAIEHFGKFWGQYFKQLGYPHPPMLLQLSPDVGFEIYSREAATNLIEGRLDNPEVPPDEP